jgi:hypothetical protein
VNFFEQELRKLIDAGVELGGVKFVGRVCYGDLGGQNRAKLEFITTNNAGKYSTLAVDILNRTDGKVDSLWFHFEDVWGKRAVSNPNYREGVIPHIWKSGLKSEWPIYKPTPRDFEILAESVNDYLSVFVERETDREQDRSAFDKALSRGRDKSDAYKASTPQNHDKTKNKEAKEQ